MNRKKTAMAHFRLLDTHNLINQLFATFEPEDTLHSMDVYRSLGYELGKNVDYFRKNLNEFPEELQNDFKSLDHLLMNFLQNLADIINMMNRSLDAPEGNIEQNTEYFSASIEPVMKKLLQTIESIIPKDEIDRIVNANCSVQTDYKETKNTSIWIFILMSTCLAFTIRYYLDQIDYLGVFFLAMFFTLMCVKIESGIKGK